jgi:acyl-CoA reductase-like NAD-dependent aldehyde dehydrogenase
MDKENAEHRLKNAQHAHSLALHIVKSLTRSDSDKTIEQAKRDERDAWHKLSAARREFVEACLESIGR